MLYSVKHGEYPDQNVLFAPPYMISSEMLKVQCQNLQNIKLFNPYFPLYPSNYFFLNGLQSAPLWQTSINKKTVIIPKQVEIKIIKNETNDYFNTISTTTTTNEENSLENKPKYKNIFDVIKINNSNENKNINNNIFSSTDSSFIENNINEKVITKFNTDIKLKKIHSTYHLKRKLSTKFQNEIKLQINKLIIECNNQLLSENKNIRIPLLAPFSKSFREDVKLDSLAKIKNISIKNYILEDIDSQNVGRSLNKKNLQLWQVIQKISDEMEIKNESFKKLKNFLENSIVYDFYKEFLNSKRLEICVENDMKKYLDKLQRLGYSKEKIDLYKVIYKEKYLGIAKGYFPF